MVVDPKELITFLDWLPGGLARMAGRAGVRDRGGDAVRLAGGGGAARPGGGHADHGRVLRQRRRSIWCTSRRGASGRLARLAIQESIRRRVVVVFAVFILILLFAGWFLDPGSIDPARLYLDFVLTATSYLVLLLALFLSSLSLPADIKNHTITRW